MATLDDFIYLTQEVKKINENQYLVSCINPAHFDKTPSLALKRTFKNGEENLLVHCFGGCIATELIQIANGKSLSNPTISPKILNKLAAGEKMTNANAEPPEYKIVKTYDYKEDGVLKFQKVRYEPKKFAYRKPATEKQTSLMGVEWLWKELNIDHLLYNLDVLKSIKDKQTLVFIDESEKNVDYLTDLGCIATCSSNTSVWKSEWNEYFTNKDVVIFPHNDTKGTEHSVNIFSHLKDVVNSFKIIQLPYINAKDDLLDWIEQNEISDELFWNAVDNAEDCKNKAIVEIQNSLSARFVDISSISVENSILEEKVKPNLINTIPAISDSEYELSLCSSCAGTGFKILERNGNIYMQTEICGGDDEESASPKPIICTHQDFSRLIKKDIIQTPQQSDIIEQDYPPDNDINIDDLGF